MILYVLALILITLPGCVMGPSYKKPEIKLPANYSVQLNGEQKKDLACWWKVFADPQLEQLIEKGLCQNYDLQVALEKIEESRNLNRIQIANLFPQINSFATTLKTNIPASLPFNNITPLRNGPFSIIGMDTIWEIDIWGRLRRKQKSAEYQWIAQIEDMRDVAIILIADIAQTYITFCALQKKIAITQENGNIDKRILELNTATFSSGLQNRQVPLEQKTIFNQDTTQTIGFLIDQQVSYHKLAYLLGITPDQLALDLTHIQNIPQPHHEIEIDKPYELLRRRPDIRKTENLLAASYEDIGSAMAEWLPKISLLGFLGKTFGPLTNVGKRISRIWAVGPVFEWPLLDFGRIYFNIKAKESSQRQAALTYQKAVINAVQEVENWLVSYVEEKNRMYILQEKLTTENKRASLTHDQFMSGIEAELTYLLSKKRMNDIKNELIDSEQKVASNFIALYKALGGGWSYV